MIKVSEIKKILIIKLRGIGDVVMSTVILDSLKDYFPNAEIDFLTEKPGSFALANLNSIKRIIIFNRESTFQRLKLFPLIRSNKYDLVIDLFSNPATAQITFLSGAKYRIGFPYKGRKYAYNIFGPAERGLFHAVDLHLQVLKSAGIPIINSQPHFEIDEKSAGGVSEWFDKLSNKTNVGIIPGGGWASKRCDPIKFAEIADAIVDKYSANIILIWGPGDKKEAEEIKQLMHNDSELAPKTTINEMGAIINRCDLILANDSGPMHISAAIGTPTLSIHGPTDPRLQGPYGSKHKFINNETLDCIVCNLLECPRQHECFLDLNVKSVIDKIDLMLKFNNIKIKLN